MAFAPDAIHGQMQWPGAKSFVSGQYTVSAGITPGVAVMTIPPQDEPLATYGPLIMSDTMGKEIILERCKLDKIVSKRTMQGLVWDLYIFDRRYAWRSWGAVSGQYNQTDTIGRYYDWSKKNPKQLVELILEAMGEVNPYINVPATGNPPVDWNFTVPAVALEQIAQTVGCVVAWNCLQDRVYVVPRGNGVPDLWDEGSISADSPTADPPENPDMIVLVGPPVRFQLKFRTQAVGKDWDDFYRPIDTLSYKPLTPKDPKKPWRYGAGSWPNCGPTNRLTRLQANDLAQKNIFKCFQVVNLALDSRPGQAGTTGGNVTDAQGNIIGGTATPAAVPPSAKRGIQVPGIGPFATLMEIERIQQVLLQDTMVEQIQPNPPDDTIRDTAGQTIKYLFYNGFRRDKPATCYGAYYRNTTGVSAGSGNVRNVAVEVANTPPTFKIEQDFSISNKEYHILTFSVPIMYELPAVNGAGQGYKEADVILETGCLIRHPKTNQFIRYTKSLALVPNPDEKRALYVFYDDCVLNVIAQYGPSGQLLGGNPTSDLGFNFADTDARATYYLNLEASKFRTKFCRNRTYNGFELFSLDGSVEQVTWTFGTDGCRTQVSLNGEHAVWIPPFPARLKLEYAPNPERRDGVPQRVEMYALPSGFGGAP